MPIFSSNTADPNLLKEIFKWGETCTKNCDMELKSLIERWPDGAKPAQLLHPVHGNLGTYLAGLGTPISNKNYEILVHVHNHDSTGAMIDPKKKWGKTLNMGGIPGVGVGARLSRGLGSAAYTAGSAALATGRGIHAVHCFGTGYMSPFCRGGRKTRRARGKKARGTRRR
jgi:hypothetical protein